MAEWGGCGLDGASYEEVRRVLMRTEEESSVEIVVKECRYRCVVMEIFTRA